MTEDERDHELALAKTKQPWTWSKAFAKAIESIMFAAIVIAIVDCASKGKILPW